MWAGNDSVYIVQGVSSSPLHLWKCIPYMNRRFGLKYHLKLQSQHSAEKETSILARRFIARLIWGSEDGCHNSLRNVGSCTEYTALYLRNTNFR
jgi:hypothetical protein